MLLVRKGREPDCSRPAFNVICLPLLNLLEKTVATYLELKEQAEKLMIEAEKMREVEVATVIDDIKQKMALYGLTIQDIGHVPTETKPNKMSTIAKYRGPEGQLWGGGRGKKPAWVYEVLKAGKNIEDYKV